jgi:hypothetical protein
MPAKTALQQVAAETRTGAVTGREEEAVSGQNSLKIRAADARASLGHARSGVNPEILKRGDIEQHAVAMQMRTGPAVAA